MTVNLPIPVQQASDRRKHDHDAHRCFPLLFFELAPMETGKSTIVALLQRFYDPTHGRVFIDGVDIKTLDVKAHRYVTLLRSMVLIV